MLAEQDGDPALAEELLATVDGTIRLAREMEEIMQEERQRAGE